MGQIGERSEKVGKGLYRGIGSSIAHKCARSGGVPVSGSQQVGCFLLFSFHLSVSTSVLERMCLRAYFAKHRVLQKLSNLPSKTALTGQ